MVWQVETRQNRFLPRLGAPLANIAVNRDDTMYAVSTLANQVVLVDAISFRNVQVFKGLAAATAVDLQGPPMVTASPKGDNIVIAAGVGTLQVYNPARDRAEYDLEVFHRNYISRTQGKAVTPVRVQHVAFCKVSPGCLMFTRCLWAALAGPFAHLRRPAPVSRLSRAAGWRVHGHRREPG